MQRRARKDTSRDFAAIAPAAIALLAALAAACTSAPPAAAVNTPVGEARAPTVAEARALADSLVRLRPVVLALLPDNAPRRTDVWLDDSLDASDGAPAVAAVTSLGDGRIRIGRAPAGLSREFLLAHELVHAQMAPGWEPLPAIMKEGLCDAIACRAVPAEAAGARAMRLFAARFAFGDQELLLTCEQPAFGGRTGARLAVESGADAPVAPLKALALTGRGVKVEDEDVAAQAVLYGYGLLLVERIEERIGLDGLRDLCARATREGQPVLPAAWVLEAADLDATPTAWNRALAEALREEELAALIGQLSRPLAEAITGAVRWRFPDLDGEAFLRAGSPRIGLHGGDLQLPVAALPPLREALLAAWSRAAPAPLSPGSSTARVDADGVHTARVQRDALTRGLLLQWMRVETSGPDGAPPQPAIAETLVRLGRDEHGAFLSSTLPFGFRDFRVEVLGVPVADLRGGLNVRRTVEDSGAITIACRLDPALAVDEAVFYGARPELLLLQRGAGDADDQRIPIAVPLRR